MIMAYTGVTIVLIIQGAWYLYFAQCSIYWSRYHDHEATNGSFCSFSQAATCYYQLLPL